MSESRIKHLVEKITEWSTAYYESGESLVSDLIYDAHFEELKQLDPDNDIFKSCGKGYVVEVSEKEKFTHPIEVGSIEKYRDFNKLLEKLDKNATWSFKLDGNSFVDYFAYGKLENVVSRGSNNIGIIRTNRFVEYVNTPTKIDFIKDRKLVAVRGEVVIPKNKYTEENGFDISKSSRNAVAGLTSRKTDYSELKHVDSVKYTFVDCETGEELNDLNWEKYYKVEKQKPVYVGGKAITEEELKELMTNHEYECDGVVFKNSDGELFAYKFEDEEVVTKCVGIEITIGSANRLTPVALLEPVNLSGSIISKASLGSMKVAETLGVFPLKSETFVAVVRSGEIIPYITRLVSSEGEVIQNEIRCPVCDSVGEYDGAHMFCKNEECPNIEREYLFKFCSFISPEGLKEKTLEKIFDHYDITSVLELVESEAGVWDITEVDGIGESTAELFDEMINNMNGELDSKIIYQTFINGCGKRASKAIVNSGFSFEEYVSGNYSLEKLYTLPNFNSNIIEELEDKQEMISEVCQYGSYFDDVEIVGEKKFCITGVRLSKEQSEQAKKAGWDEKSVVSKNLDVLVVKNKTSASSKTEKAKSLGVKIVSLDEFLKMIEK